MRGLGAVTADSLVGGRVDEYDVLSLLARGGMGRVYLAVDRRLERYVALKVVDAGQLGDRQALRRFQREAQAIAQLDHPHIVRLYRFGESNGFHYMAMQYVEGADLHALLASYHNEKKFMPLAEVSRIVQEVGQALDYAHERGVVHRDVKPANIVLNRDGRAVLADFGLVLLEESGTTAGDAFGTPHYMAPEQVVSSAAADGLSDLYSLGVILYEMVTGRVPFDHANPVEVALKHVHETPPRPDALRPEVGEPLAAVIVRALAKEPQERFATGRELAAALEAALPALPEPPPTAPFLSVPDRITKQFKRTGGLPPAAVALPRRTPSGLRTILPAALLPLLPLARPQAVLAASGCLLLGVLALLTLTAAYALSGSRRPALAPGAGGSYTIYLPFVSAGEPEPAPADESGGLDEQSFRLQQRLAHEAGKMPHSEKSVRHDTPIELSFRGVFDEEPFRHHSGTDRAV
jgi:serine/threonine protein kinase